MRGWRIPEERRHLFKEVLGEPIDINEIKNNDKMTITVGDVVSLTLWKEGVIPFLSVYDGMTERRELTEFADFVIDEKLEETVVSNKPGEISLELNDAIKNAFNSDGGLIHVEGEEDLALMPVILYAPDGARIVYGWPGEGMMAVTTDEAIRSKVKTLWKQMEEIE